MKEVCSLYRTRWITGMGYVVYRHFPEMKCSVEDWAKAHKVAVFVCENEAMEFCVLRNDMTTKYGTDELKIYRRAWRPGEHLNIQQAATKQTRFARRRPTYTCCFEIDETGDPVWTGAGVRPRPDTIERVRRYVFTGSMDESVEIARRRR